MPFIILDLKCANEIKTCSADRPVVNHDESNERLFSFKADEPLGQIHRFRRKWFWTKEESLKYPQTHGRISTALCGRITLLGHKRTVMKSFFTLLMLLCLGLESQARLKQFWSYDSLNDKATLVVIATPIKTAETSERAALPNIATVHSDGTKENLMGKGVETSFQILTVLKGERSTNTLVLHHFTLLAKPGIIMNGPDLVSFDPKDKKRFLMFLLKEADGRYIAVSGQTDPQDAIKEIVERYP